MIDHIGISVSDFTTSADFYTAALAPLGVSRQMEIGEDQTGGHGAHLGFGTANDPFFWIASGKPAQTGVHVAFRAESRAAVDAFYSAAMDAGGRDNGGPGLRPEYHPDYYAAFVFDPDGNNIEAVCHTAAA